LHYDRDAKLASFWGLQGSASVHDKELTITAVNPSTNESRLAEIALRGATVKSANMTFLSHSDIHAHNTFEQPDVVASQTKPLSLNGGSLAVEFPQACVAALNIQLN